MTRCGVVYPGVRFETGDPVRCDGLRGHDGPHFHSFAMRSWNRCEWCDRGRKPTDGFHDVPDEEDGVVRVRCTR